MTPANQSRCRRWIALYVAPSRNINHMHTELSLRKMMAEDTRVQVGRREFRELMSEAGYEPANYGAGIWEYRISSKPLRRRARARVTGWMASTNPERLTRLA